MKLKRVHIISAQSCGGLLDGLDIYFPDSPERMFDTVCLIGQNGTGKSQLLQVIAEIFQSIYRSISPEEERLEGNSKIEFLIEYSIFNKCIKICRIKSGRYKPKIEIFMKVDNRWEKYTSTKEEILKLLPKKIVGYTSGDNETLSFPFLVSRRGYADEVANVAKNTPPQNPTKTVIDPPLMLIDYGTNLEVLIANLLIEKAESTTSILKNLRLKKMNSFRCTIQLNHPNAPKTKNKSQQRNSRKGIQLTDELEKYVDNLKRCATCFDYDDEKETYILDFFVDIECKKAFHFFWDETLALYSSFHKLSMLNDLMISKKTRDRFKTSLMEKRFATRLPEPQDEEKVFRFNNVTFISETDYKVVDYVSLSDGEHQLIQLLGMFTMFSFENVLFLLDEPESHFNPEWRTKFFSRILELPTAGGKRKDDSSAVASQSCILTTHAPFVPSDLHRENIFIFSKDNARIIVEKPKIETFGSTFDDILSECFKIDPPISLLSSNKIESLMASSDIEQIEREIKRLGDSVEKIFLIEHLEDLKEEQID